MQAEDAAHPKPDVTLAQLAGLDVTPGKLNDLLEGHQELAHTHLGPGGGQVRGVGITAHQVDGRATGQAALVVLVHSLDGVEALPSVNGRGVPIVYEAVDEITPCAAQAGRFRPAVPGTSIAPCAVTYAGTLGCVVQAGGVRHILSCNHVLADQNSLPLGSPISQPAVQDGGHCPADVIANLSHVVPLNFTPGQYSPVNAAIAAIAPGVQVDPRILGQNGQRQTLIAPVAGPNWNMSVQKSGRTTGVTQGTVQMIGMSLIVMFWPGRQAKFRNVFSIAAPSGAFSEPGDSGALVTASPSGQPVGMLFAASGGPQPRTFAHPLSDVLTALTGVAGSPVEIVFA